MKTPERPNRRARQQVMRAETLGLVVLAVIILLVLVLRWGKVIPWGAR